MEVPIDLTRPPNDCVFCRRRDVAFDRAEHPIPESLGNDDFILLPGWVCNACNQYFGAKIEGRVLSMPPFSMERAAFAVRTKKGRLSHHQDDGFALAATGFSGMLAIVDQGNTADAQRVMDTGLYIPDTPPGYDDLIARFLLKIGLEVLLAQGVDVYDQRYDLARRCARYGERVHEWDVAYGVYPNRIELLVARRWDGLGPINTHQIYQFEAGVMDSGDVMFNFIYATSIMAVNLSRPPATEYILGFNARNSFALRSRWELQVAANCQAPRSARLKTPSRDGRVRPLIFGGEFSWSGTRRMAERSSAESMVGQKRPNKRLQRTACRPLLVLSSCSARSTQSAEARAARLAHFRGTGDPHARP